MPSPTISSAPGASSAQGDRRAVSDRMAGACCARRRRLSWWLEQRRHRADAAHAGGGLPADGGMDRSPVCSNPIPAGNTAPRPCWPQESAAAGTRLAGHTLDHPGMPDAVRLEMPDWLLPHLVARFGDVLADETAGDGPRGAARSAREPAAGHAGATRGQRCRRKASCVRTHAALPLGLTRRRPDGW